MARSGGLGLRGFLDILAMASGDQEKSLGPVPDNAFIDADGDYGLENGLKKLRDTVLPRGVISPKKRRNYPGLRAGIRAGAAFPSLRRG